VITWFIQGLAEVLKQLQLKLKLNALFVILKEIGLA